jgi:hypothetical protein
MKVLLIQPPPGTDFGFTNVLRFESLGVECVGAALEHDDHEVRVIDMRLNDWSSLQSQYKEYGVR